MVRDMQINFLWLLFILVGKIYPPMQEHFHRPLLKCKAFLVNKIRVSGHLIYSLKCLLDLTN